MDYELPTQFDLIVIGTGIVESILSAAASRIGKTVLHIDRDDFYGGLWASFNLETIDKLCNPFPVSKLVLPDDITLNNGDKVLPVGNELFNLKHTFLKWNVPDKIEQDVKENVDDSSEQEINNEISDVGSKEINKEILMKEALIKDSRKFNIDIAPKLQFARGDFVELLISSNIARYSEYRSISRILTWINGQLEVVPCSRSDVFTNAKVSVIEKRMLMKLLTACMDGDENEFVGYENKTFQVYLKEKKLTDNIVHYILYAIAMCTDETLCLDGVQNVKRFLNSLGRFGKTPFLYSMYGSGELSQAFCRLSAVFGGVYALNQQLNGLIFNKDDTFKGLIVGKQRINAEYLVMSIEKCPEVLVKTVATSFISRAIFITDGSIMKSEKEHLSLLLFPSDDGNKLCNIIEMGSLTGTCPKNIYIVHMYTQLQTDPQEDLKYYVSKLFQNEDDAEKDNRPKILWSFYYSVPDTNNLDLRCGLPKNVFVCPGPDIDLDYDFSVKKAKEIFTEMFPDLEFLPRAPDPEEIIIGDDDIVSDVEEINSTKMENENDENAEKEKITIENDKNAQGDS